MFRILLLEDAYQRMEEEWRINAPAILQAVRISIVSMISSAGDS